MAALELLRRIATLPLPCTVVDSEEIVLLRALRAAGLVQASIPHPVRIDGRAVQEAARVELVTRQGWNALIASHTSQEPQRRVPLPRTDPVSTGPVRRLAP